MEHFGDLTTHVVYIFVQCKYGRCINLNHVICLRLFTVICDHHSRPGPVMTTGVNSDTAKACGTVSITTMPMAHPPPAGSGKKTTTHVESGRRTQAQRPRSLYSRVRGTGRRSRGSSPLCGTWDEIRPETGTCPCTRESPQIPSPNLPLGQYCHSPKHGQTKVNVASEICFTT